MSYSTRVTKNYEITRIKRVIVQEVLIISAVVQEVHCIYYLSVRPLLLSNTLSQMWDRLNLPMLLFKEGLLTLM